MSFIGNLFSTIISAVTKEEILKDLRRKGARLLIGTSFILLGIYINAHYGIEVVRNILLVNVIFVVGSDYARLSFNLKVPFLEPFVMHSYEKEGFQGATYAAIGNLLALSFTDFDIAMAAICMFMYGDAVANIIGKTFGKAKLFGRNKTIVGSLAMFVVSYLVGTIFVHDVHTPIFMALLATAIEVIIVAPADDFAIPLFTALGGQYFGALLGLRSYLEGFLAGVILFVVSASVVVGFVGLFNLTKKVLNWPKKSST